MTRQLPAGGQEAVALPGALGNSQTQPTPAVKPPEAAVSHDNAHSKANVGLTLQLPPQQQQQQQPGHDSARASVMCQPSSQADPSAAPTATRHTSAAGHLALAAAPQQAEQTDLPAKADTLPGAAAASRQALCCQRPSRWPGKCTQGASADANDLHGVAAVVVNARRSKSCSATGRQHTAKKLVFQQRKLAQQPSLQVGIPTSDSSPQIAKSCDRAAKTGSAHMPVQPLPAIVCPVYHDHQQQAEHNHQQEIAHKLVGVHSLATAQVGLTTAKWRATAAQADLPAAMPVASHRVRDATASTTFCQQHEAVSAPDQRRYADQADLQRRCAHREPQQADDDSQAHKGSQGSQEQWEAAVSKLRHLAEKHSQDSQDGAPADIAAGVDPRAAGTEEQRAMPAVLRPAATQGDSICPDHNLQPPVDGSGPQRQAAAHKPPVPQASAVAGTAHQRQLPPEKPSVNDRVSQGMPAPTANTGLSHFRTLMHQQRQQQQQAPESVQHTAQGPQPGSGMLHCQQSEAQLVYQTAVIQGEQRHKRKRPEAGHVAEGTPIAADPASAQLPCKKQCLPAPSSKGAHNVAAGGHCAAAPGMTLQRRQPADASHAASSVKPGQTALADVTATDGGNQHMPSQVVAWPVRCKPKPCLDVAPNALAKADVTMAMAKAVSAAGSALVGASAEQAATAALTSDTAAPAAQAAAAAVKATRAEVAADAGRAEATALVVAVAEQENRSQGASEAAPAGFRLDLSSEEDPLLCTQRLHSSQGLHAICHSMHVCTCIRLHVTPCYLRSHCLVTCYTPSEHAPVSGAIWHVLHPLCCKLCKMRLIPQSTAEHANAQTMQSNNSCVQSQHMSNI